MSKILKGVIVYSILILGALLIVGSAVVGIMFLSGTSEKPLELFGYKALYLGHVVRPEVGYDTKSFNSNATININVIAGDYDVFIVERTDHSEIGIKKIDSVIGLYKGAYEKQVISELKEVSGNEYDLTIRVSQPKGLLTFGDSNVIVFLSSQKNFVYNLNIVTTSGNVKIDGANSVIAGQQDYDLNVSKISVTTTSGDLFINKVNKKSADLSSLPEGSVVLDSLYLSTKTGNFDLTNIKNLRLDNPTSDNPINIISKRGKFRFNNVFGAMNLVGQNQLNLEANIINTNGAGFTYDSEYGYFKINKLDAGITANNINSKNVNIEIGEVVGEIKIKTENGKIDINKAYNTINLTTISGNIYVNEALGAIAAHSKKGDIKINSYKSTAYFTNNSGYIQAKYTGDLTQPSNATIIQVARSYVKLENIYNALDIKATGSANIELYFQPLAQANITHKIDISAGTVKLNFYTTPSIEAFTLIANGNFSGVYGTSNIAELLANANGQPVNVLGGGQCTMNIKTGTGKAKFYTHTRVGE